MKLFEYEAKALLRQHGILTPRGTIAKTASQAVEAARKLRSPFAVKSQILAGGRGKAGGIQFASTLEEVEKAAGRLLQSEINGFKVERVLVEEKIQTKRELYFAVTLDRSKRGYVAIASSRGGVNIEETAIKEPTSIVRTPLESNMCIAFSAAKEIAAKIGLLDVQQANFARTLRKICRIGLDLDAVLIEVNPIAETPEGSFIALDSRLVVDDNALYRHPALRKLRFEKNRDSTEQEIEAMKKGIAYVKLEGEVGIMGNGAGLVMATLDVVRSYGSTPANFLDLGGGAPLERISFGLKTLLMDPDAKVVLVNVIGGLTRCDEVAEAIVAIKDTIKLAKPIFARLSGTYEAEGRQILLDAGLRVFNSMEEAARQAAEITKRQIG